MTDGDDKGRQFRQALEASSVGLVFPIAIAIGYFWGWLMDRWFGTSPWLSWIFAAFGVIAGFINLFRFAGKDGT
ncbi:MAG TPA: AtpZ/AtpI family protein [Thermoanaerobaculia bacterium]|nr:AtpZ/AtpI family protein [Thermoanaerobaculia bacterium]